MTTNMIDFDHIDYLKNGNTRQKAAYQVLINNQIFDHLENFTPFLTGTIPIAIDIESSDLDICCSYRDRTDFIKKLSGAFNNYEGFMLSDKIINNEETVIANFFISGFEFEIFGQAVPVKSQNAYRHMLIEHQILQAKGEKFRQEIIDLKKSGLKTEPAFAKLLGLAGDPYKALLSFKPIRF